jgi:diguanylate cyclase (GGDEF)-like protein
MRIEVEEKLRHLATHDPLTGLPNRNLLMDRLSTVLAQAKRAETSTALAFIDLDGFKAVNDTQGHEAGDILLMEAAQRLLGCIRESDTLARIGGDEFIVSFFAVAERKSVPSMAEKILKSLNRAFDINGQKVRISASIGISFYPDDGATPDTLMKSADQAMYEVKEAGKNGIAMAGGVKA